MDIYNWDMVCAVSCQELNKKLKVSASDSFREFTWSDNAGNQISGVFDGWEIVSGGDAQRINIITPIRTGTLRASVLGQSVDVGVDGLCPRLQVELAFVNGGSGGDTHLKFNFACVRTKGSAVTFGDGSIVVLDNDVNNLFPEEDAIIPALFCELLAQMIVARQEELAFIFAEVLTIPPESENAWMKLHLLQYAYNEKIKGELGCLAVLGILKNNPSPPHPDELQLIFDSSLVRDGGSIGFMISRHMFMEAVVLPGMTDVFKGSKLSQFCLGDYDVIKNNGDISLDEINGYTPYFNNLNMEVVDDKIIINNTWGRCDVVKKSSYVTFDLSAMYAPVLTVTKGGSKVNLDCVNGPFFTSKAHDTTANIFWIFGGWVVDALIQGIRSQMSTLLFDFGSNRITFDIYPVNFSTDSEYKECGLAENFFMRD